MAVAAKWLCCCSLLFIGTATAPPGRPGLLGAPGTQASLDAAAAWASLRRHAPGPSSTCSNDEAGDDTALHKRQRTDEAAGDDSADEDGTNESGEEDAEESAEDEDSNAEDSSAEDDDGSEEDISKDSGEEEDSSDGLSCSSSGRGNEVEDMHERSRATSKRSRDA